MLRGRCGPGGILIRTTYLLIACATVFASATSASAAGTAVPDGFCPKLDRKARVYLVGSSTMGSVLGPMMQTSLHKRWKIDARRWGKASSGLARPDYHDWPKEMPRLMARHRPDFTVVSLGTNDNQPLRKGKGWIKMENPRWPEVYRARVDKMLNSMAGKDRSRRIIWMGPVAFDGKNARVIGPRIDEILRTAIEEFDGHAAYVEIHKATRNSRGRPIETFKRPGRTPEPARTPDGVHLTTAAVQHLLERPVLDILASCLDPKPEPEEAAPAEAAPETPAPAAAEGDKATESPGDPAAAEDEPAKADNKPAAAPAEPPADDPASEGAGKGS